MKTRHYRATAHPSLALAKYWGKLDRELNIPATSSIGVSLESFYCKVTLTASSKMEQDRCSYSGTPAKMSQQLRSMLDAVRSQYPLPILSIDSVSNIPFAAGLAGSSAYFAALAAAIACLLEEEHGISLAAEHVSAIARRGSASAARAVLGGFQRLPAGEFHATFLFPATYWNDLRIICIIIHDVQKSMSSREAMNRCADTSPMYEGWRSFAHRTEPAIALSIEQRDLSTLGGLVVQNTYAMFACMIASNPPIRYWTSRTLLILDKIAELRSQGVMVWETMDAGPQVKLICSVDELDKITRPLYDSFPDLDIKQSCVGEGAVSWSD